METDDTISRIEREWGRRLSESPPGSCLEAEELIELVERGSRSRGYLQRMEHVSLCPVCRALLNELHGVESRRQELPAPASRRTFPWKWGMMLPVGAAVAAALALLFARMPPTRIAENPPGGSAAPPGLTVPTPTPAPSPSGTGAGPRGSQPGVKPAPSRPATRRSPGPDVMARRPDGPGTGSPLSRPGSRRETPSTRAKPATTRRPQLPPVIAAYPHRFPHQNGSWAEGGTLLAKEIVSAYLTALPAPFQPRRSQGGRIRLLSPDPRLGRGLQERQPTFEWEVGDSSREYKVTLEAQAQSVREDDETVPLDVEWKDATGRARPRSPLQPGREYALTIVPIRSADDPDLTPLRPAVFRFLALTDAQVRDRDWARAHKEAAPLTSAMIFWHLRSYREALDALPSSNDDPKLDGLRRSFEAAAKAADQPDAIGD